MAHKELIKSIGAAPLHLLYVWYGRVHKEGARPRAWALFTYSRASVALREGLVALSKDVSVRGRKFALARTYLELAPTASCAAFAPSCYIDHIDVIYLRL